MYYPLFLQFLRYTIGAISFNAPKILYLIWKFTIVQIRCG